MADAVQQHQIGAGLNRQMQISDVGGGGVAGIDDDQLQGLFLPAFAFEQALKQHRMAIGGVGADQHHRVATVEVVVAAGGTIAAEATGVARHRRTHAEAGVGIKVVAAKGAFEQLLGEVIIFGQELAGAIHRQACWPAIRQHLLHLRHDAAEGFLPADRPQRLIDPLTKQRCGEAVVVQRFTHRGPFDAHLPQGGWMLPVSAHRPGIAVARCGGISDHRRRFELQATSHAAVGALGAGRMEHGKRFQTSVMATEPVGEAGQSLFLILPSQRDQQVALPLRSP